MTLPLASTTLAPASHDVEISDQENRIIQWLIQKVAHKSKALYMNLGPRNELNADEMTFFVRPLVRAFPHRVLWFVYTQAQYDLLHTILDAELSSEEKDHDDFYIVLLSSTFSPLAYSLIVFPQIIGLVTSGSSFMAVHEALRHQKMLFLLPFDTSQVIVAKRLEQLSVGIILSLPGTIVQSSTGTLEHQMQVVFNQDQDYFYYNYHLIYRKQLRYWSKVVEHQDGTTRALGIIESLVVYNHTNSEMMSSTCEHPGPFWMSYYCEIYLLYALFLMGAMGLVHVMWLVFTWTWRAAVTSNKKYRRKEDRHHPVSRSPVASSSSAS